MSRTLPPPPDLARLTLGVLAIALLIAACLWILQPFIGAIVWATMIVVATWPAMLRLEARLGGRRGLAVAIVTIAMLLLVVVPLVFAAVTIVDHVDEVTDIAKSASTLTIPPPPDWLARIPAVGRVLTEKWQALAATARDDIVAQAAPYARAAIEWFAGKVGGLGLLLLQFLLTLIATAVLYASGEQAAEGVQRFARRLAGERGERAVDLAGRAIRAVALGIVVTATVQSVLAAIGLAVCGVPYVTVLTAIIFMLCLIQLGPILVMVPAVIWVYWTGHAGWGTVLLVWTVFVGAIDNVLRPLLIKRGADLPLPLIFIGAIGGLVGFGVVGLFIGPVVLAVTYRLLEWWIADIDHPDVAETL
jgi:predicted PurR-regulated permease PerM